MARKASPEPDFDRWFNVSITSPHHLSFDTHMPHAKMAASTPGVVSLTATVGRERMIPPPHIRRSEPDCLQERADAAVAAFVVDLSAGGS
jgi:hypothetical protein